MKKKARTPMKSRWLGLPTYKRKARTPKKIRWLGLPTYKRYLVFSKMWVSWLFHGCPGFSRWPLKAELNHPVVGDEAGVFYGFPGTDVARLTGADGVSDLGPWPPV